MFPLLLGTGPIRAHTALILGQSAAGERGGGFRIPGGIQMPQLLPLRRLTPMSLQLDEEDAELTVHGGSRMDVALTKILARTLAGAQCL